MTVNIDRRTIVETMLGPSIMAGRRKWTKDKVNVNIDKRTIVETMLGSSIGTERR